MTHAEMKTFVAELLETNKETIKSIEFALDLNKNSIVSHAWIVTDSKSPVCAFEVILDGKQVVDLQLGQPHKVNRFTQQDAETVAANCENGNGNLVARHWEEVATQALKNAQEQVELLEKRLAEI